MKRIALLAVIGAGLMALPGTATAINECPGGGAVETWGSALGGGSGVGGNAAVGVCVDTDAAPGVADGGYVEVGNGGSYGVVDGSDDNAGNAGGYAGFVTPGSVADSSKDSCDGSDDASPSHNTGGCFWLKAPANLNLTNAVTTMFVCGNTSGKYWAQSSRDGCSIP